MTETLPTRASRLKLTDVCVVDCDVHIDDQPSALAPHSEMPWRKALENAAKVPRRYLRIPGFNRLPETIDEFVEPQFPGDIARRQVLTPEQMRQDLTAISVDIGLVFPDNLLAIATLPKNDFAAAIGRAYNRWLVEECVAGTEGLYAAIMAVPHDPADAAKEIVKYAGNPKVACVYLPTAAVYPLWGDRKYDPILAAAEEASLPVVLHSVFVVSPHFPFNIEQFDTQMARHMISHTFSIMANMISIVTTGVPVRFPKLKIVYTEAGVSWVPYVMWHLDKEYSERRREVPFLKERPSTYIKQMYFATQPIEEPADPHELVALMNFFDGENQILFASDWPHHDFDHPRQVFDLPLADEGKRKILGLNALRLFGIPEQKFATGNA